MAVSRLPKPKAGLDAPPWPMRECPAKKIREIARLIDLGL
jgi:hypothetical protein